MPTPHWRHHNRNRDTHHKLDDFWALRVGGHRGHRTIENMLPREANENAQRIHKHLDRLSPSLAALPVSPLEIVVDEVQAKDAKARKERQDQCHVDTAHDRRKPNAMCSEAQPAGAEKQRPCEAHGGSIQAHNRQTLGQRLLFLLLGGGLVVVFVSCSKLRLRNDKHAGNQSARESYREQPDNLRVIVKLVLFVFFKPLGVWQDARQTEPSNLDQQE
mmetsp:Transcript_130370/g.260055  ORF Transcript_130370/g.260055 Transcript_130370/m.260055 type:complete len:217 (-) Transcript_130370:1415-2065(-)